MAKITNSSDVSADISLNITNKTTPAITKIANPDTTYADTDVQGLFSIAYTVSTTELTAFPATPTSTVTLAKGESAYIYANVTWTSADTASSNGDELDTWVGENVASVSWSIACTAVQATELPTT